MSKNEALLGKIADGRMRWWYSVGNECRRFAVLGHCWWGGVAGASAVEKTGGDVGGPSTVGSFSAAD